MEEFPLWSCLKPWYMKFLMKLGEKTEDQTCRHENHLCRLCVDWGERWNVSWKECKPMEPCYRNSLAVEPKGLNTTNTKAIIRHKPEPVQCGSHPHSSSHRSILILSPVCTPCPKKIKVNLKRCEHHMELVFWWTTEIEF